MIEHNTTNKKKIRFQLLLLFVVFLLPLLLAGLLYSKHSHFIQARTNYGQLINPPFSIDALHTQLTVKGKWIMLLFYPDPCLQLCEQDLYHLRQIRTAMGADQDRLQRAIMTYSNQNTDPKLMALLQTPYSGTLHVLVDAKRYDLITKRYIHATDAKKSGTIYFIDPHGNVMMIYPPHADPKGVFKDLQRLLKVSQIG